MSDCHHWRTKVAVGSWQVACSGLLACPPGDVASWESPPAAGFYLDPAWRDVLADVPWSARFVEWPDRGVIRTQELGLLVGTIAHEMADGRTVEIACVGGHGRTGTLLATLIARLEGLDAASALRIVRERYCTAAIETLGQIALLYRALGEEPPPLDAFASRNG